MEETPLRKSATDILEILSSLDVQIKYEESVPTADVPAELKSIWFDDFFQPGESFNASFSERELSALGKFNTFYDLRVKKLPNSSEGLETLHSSLTWLEIVSKAKETLDVFYG